MLKLTNQGHHVKKLNSKGFSHLEVLLIIVVLALVGGAGYYVLKQNNKHQNSTSNQPSTTQTQTNSNTQTATQLKEYKNDEYGFSFQYPSDWNLSVDLKDIGRGMNEGDVVVTSPYGTKVHFGPNGGGKGGDCWDDEANARTTRTCDTQTILFLEKLPSSPATNPIYLYHASLTFPTSAREDIAGKTKCMIFISNLAAETTGSELGVFIHPYDEIQLKQGYVTIQVEGKDSTKSDTKAYFDTNEVKEATPVLKSFKIL
jgi:hypothetical protein